MIHPGRRGRTFAVPAAFSRAAESACKKVVNLRQFVLESNSYRGPLRRRGTPIDRKRRGTPMAHNDSFDEPRFEALYRKLYPDLLRCAEIALRTGCGATSFLRNSDKIYEKKRNASQAPGRRFWPSAAARTRTRSWRPLWTRWWPPGSLIVRSVGWRWTTRPTPCDCYCSKWGGM